MRETNLVKVFWGLVVVLVIGNLLFLDVKLIQDKKEKIVERLAVVEKRLTQEVGYQAAPAGDEDQASIETEVGVEIQATLKPETVYVEAPEVIKEVFIPLGSGSTTATAWTNTGAQSYIDTDVYSKIEAVYFEGSLRSNSGGVRARLWQNNEGFEVPGAEIEAVGGASLFKSSGKIFLSGGNKLYIVQVRSATGQEVFVENARVKLVIR